MSIAYAGKEFNFYNPDGSQIRVRGWGNQFAAVFETLDGYTVVQDPVSGFYHYATSSADGNNLVATGIPVSAAAAPETLALPRGVRPSNRPFPIAASEPGSILTVQRQWEVRREMKRMQFRSLAAATGVIPEGAPPPAGTTGNYVGLCLLVQFPDVSATITQQQVDDFCNRPGYTGFGNNGSVFDYYQSVSDHKLHYTNIVTAYYTAKHSRAYYTDTKITFGVRAQELVTEALNDLHSKSFDFSSLSNDAQGFVYALNVFYAGDVVNAWSQGLWPHSSKLSTTFTGAPSKTFADYQITNMGTELTLRTFCHENGHMICDFPDLYDTAGTPSYGVGNYCLMGYGASDSNPAQICAYLKNAAGWTSKLTNLSPGLTTSVASGINDFLILSRSATEYFIAENREQAGRDTFLPDAGLAIWHVDQLGSNTLEQMTPGQHYECTLEQADGHFDLEKNVNAGDSTDLFGGPSAVAFGANSAPNSNWWDGNSSGLEIDQVSNPAASMTVTVRYPGPVGQMRQVFSGGDGVIYVIGGNGDLLWYRHDGRSDGSFAWAQGSPKKVGVGWSGLRKVFPGDNGVIYGINDNGDLLWYRHDGRDSGSFTWAAGSPKKVGNGWGALRTVFSGGSGVIYAINDKCDLLWYRHDGHNDGTFTWAAGSGNKVGNGWGGLRTVFSGGDGIIYTINQNGDLLWYRHDGRNDGTFAWAAGSGNKVGNGWNSLRTVFSGGNGLIYGITPNGALLWYRHDGRNNGSFVWAAGSPKTVGVGWVIAGHGIIYAIEPVNTAAPQASGRLLWYRHDGCVNGDFVWASASSKVVGTGWSGLQTVFSGGDDLVYGINDGGDLLWYRHDGRDEGTFTWAAGSPKKVGVGWGGLHNVFSGGNGVIYGINDAGDLLWYRHDGRQDGTFVWAAGSPKKVGAGWGGLQNVFSGGDGLIYTINAAGDLLWYRHDGRFDGSFVWSPGSGNKVGTGWGSLTKVFGGGEGVIYGLNANGDLLWYRHDGRQDGSFVWAAGSPKKVGVGWGGFAKLFSGS